MHSRHPRPWIPLAVGVLALATVAVACQGAASPAPSAGAPSVAAPASGTSATAASSSATSSVAPAPPSGSDVPAGSMGSTALQHQAPDLEARIPDSVGDVALRKFSLKGNSVFTAGAVGQAGAAVQAGLAGLGRTMDDVTIAAGLGTGVTILVYRVSGVDGNRLLAVFEQAANEAGSAFTLADGSKGGKAVKVGTPSSGSGSTVYFYTTGDLLYFVTASDDAKVEAALAALP